MISGSPPTLWWLFMRAASRVPLSMTSEYSVPCTRNVASSAILPASSSKVRMNSSPMILRFASGSATPSSLLTKRSLASTWIRGTSEFFPKASTTCSASFCLRNPWSTNTQVRLSPMARWTSIAAVEESTPPERPQMAFASPTCSLIFSTASVMMFTGVQSGVQPQASKRKFLRISVPYSVCRTSGWNCTPK